MATLEQRMKDDLELRGLSPKTREAYLFRVTQFARYFNRLPDKLGEDKVKEHLLHLVHQASVCLSPAPYYNQRHFRASIAMVEFVVCLFTPCEKRFSPQTHSRTFHQASASMVPMLC